MVELAPEVYLYPNISEEPQRQLVRSTNLLCLTTFKGFLDKKKFRNGRIFFYQGFYSKLLNFLFKNVSSFEMKSFDSIKNFSRGKTGLEGKLNYRQDFR